MITSLSAPACSAASIKRVRVKIPLTNLSLPPGSNKSAFLSLYFSRPWLYLMLTCACAWVQDIVSGRKLVMDAKLTTKDSSLTFTTFTRFAAQQVSNTRIFSAKIHRRSLVLANAKKEARIAVGDLMKRPNYIVIPAREVCVRVLSNLAFLGSITAWQRLTPRACARSGIRFASRKRTVHCG